MQICTIAGILDDKARSQRRHLIAYAAWISAAFHLKVIRVFLSATDQRAKLSEADKKTIREAVAHKAGRDGEAYQSIYNALHTHFHVNSYHELPAGCLQEALRIVAAFESPALPAPQETPSLKSPLKNPAIPRQCLH